jgi:hypothetical protein
LDKLNGIITHVYPPRTKNYMSASEPAKTESPPATATTSEPVVEPAAVVAPEPPRIEVLSDAFVKTYKGNRSCFVLGATGASGCRISRDLINSGAFETIKLIVRRAMPEEFVPTPPSGVKIVRFRMDLL